MDKPGLFQVETVTERREKLEQVKLPELKILGYRVLDQGNIKWICSIIYIVEIQDKGVVKFLVTIELVLNT